MLEHLLAQPLPELDDSFLMAGWAEMPALAGERQQIFVAAGFASHPGKAQVEVSAVEIPVDHILSIGSKESVSALIAFFPVPFQVFKMVLRMKKMREKTAVVCLGRLFLLLAAIGLAACANGANKEGEEHITDRTGERWDVSQAVQLGFHPDRFQYGIGRHAFTTLDDSDLSSDTSSVPAFERVIGVASEGRPTPIRSANCGAMKSPTRTWAMPRLQWGIDRWRT
jgi:hypothetical protein